MCTDPSLPSLCPSAPCARGTDSKPMEEPELGLEEGLGGPWRCRPPIAWLDLGTHVHMACV